MKTELITVQQYFQREKGTLANILESISLLIQQNAMNDAPTEEEMKVLQEKMAEVEQSLARLEQEAGRQIINYRQKHEESALKAGNLIKEQSNLYQELECIREDKKQVEIKLAEEQGIYEEERRRMLEAQKALLQIENDKEGIYREAERRQEELAKYWWVPFYNLYLAIDTLVQDYEGNFKSKEKAYRIAQEKCNDISIKLEESNRRLNSLEREEREKSEKGQQKEREIEHLASEIKNLKDALVYWEGVLMKASSQKSRLVAGKASPDVLMEIMVLLDEFS